MKRLAVYSFLCCGCLPVLLLANDDPIKILPTREAIEIDGVLREKIWSQLEPLPLTMHQPTFGDSITERTEIFLTYDEDYLYLSGNLYASDPSMIQATTKKRDAMVGNTDWFGLILDTYNDNENGLAFFTNPNGMRLDLSIFNDAVGTMANMPLNVSWNTFWDVAVSRTEEGWFAEMRIPFSSLRFQDQDGEVTMGVIIWRWLPSKNATYSFPAIKPDWGPFSVWKPSQCQKMQLSGVYAKRPVYLTPYLLGGFGQDYELNAEETRYGRSDDLNFEVGGDLKYSLTSNLTLDLTANTDFAQVEADDQQVNLTRFSLFFPEKRQFFQERSGVFEVKMGQQNRLFYSRRIGLDDDGRPVRIIGGARVSGRLGKWDVGLMNMQTARSEELRSENYSVLRLRKQVLNSYSYLGGILTNRSDFKGNYNTTYGLDGVFRLFRNDYLFAKIAQTMDSKTPNDWLSADPAKIYIQWERRQINDFHYDLSYSRTGVHFDPGIGFEARDNYSRYGGIIGYGWIPGGSSPLLRHRVFTDSYLITGNTSGKAESAFLSLGYEMESKGGYRLLPQLRWNYEFLEEELSFSDEAVIPPGDYSFYDINLQFNTPFSGQFYVFMNVQVGAFYDGNLASALFWPTWNASASLEASLTYSVSRIAFPQRDQRDYIHVGGLKMLYMLDTKFSVAAFWQYNSLISASVGNLRLRWNPKEGNDLYIVYNDVWNTDREREFPHLPFSAERAIVLKYTYTFKL